MTLLQADIGIVSHSVPPSMSGQAIMLGRILSALPSERVCLISRENGESSAWRRHHLPRLRLLPAPTTSAWWAPTLILNAAWAISRRSAQIEAIAHAERLRVLIGCTGDLYDFPSAFVAARRLSIPFIAYAFDDYRYQWTKTNRAIAAIIEPLVLRGAARVIVPNEALQAAYRARYGLDAVVVHNPSASPPADKENPAGERTAASVVYTGSIYHAHYDAFRRLIRAIETLPRPAVKLVVYTPQSQQELAENGICGKSVEYHPRVNEDEAWRIMRRADILFLPLAFSSPIPEVVRTSAPGKLSDYLAAGRPILAHAPRNSFVSDFLGSRQCAVVVGDPSAEQLADALKALLDDDVLRQRVADAAIRVAANEFALANVAQRFRGVLAECGVDIR